MRALKLKQASVALGVPPKDLQNFVQSGVVRPRRKGPRFSFDRETLVSAKVAFYLKDSLGMSTRYLSQFTGAMALQRVNLVTFRARDTRSKSELRCLGTDSDRGDLCRRLRSRLRARSAPLRGTCRPADHATRESTGGRR